MVEETVREYYAALRAGEPIAPFFAAEDPVVKVGISERLTGIDAVRAGLREQSHDTAEWTVGSRDLRTGERDGTGWFADLVDLAWTDTREGRRHAFETRWSGTLLEDDGWEFVGMHVSAPHEL